MSKADKLRITLAQLNLRVGDIQGNADRIMETAQTARDQQQADLVVFPELALTSYPPEDLLLRPGFYQRVEDTLQHLVTQIHGIDVIVGYPARLGRNHFNACAHFRDAEIRATYYKQQLPNYAVFDEKRYFQAGKAAVVTDIKGMVVALSICEDIWKPSPAKKAAAAGAEVIININASPYHTQKKRQREQALRASVAASGLPIVYVNLVGGQDELVFDGGSVVMDAGSAIQFQAPQFQEGLYDVELERRNRTVVPVPGQKEKPLEFEKSIYQALVLGVKDYVDKNHFKGVVMGLSGGIDSALTLAVAVDALGRDRVEAVFMPSQYSADMSAEDAQQEAKTLGVEFHVISIGNMVSACLESLTETLEEKKEDVTEQNIQARCRGVLLMAISNRKGLMVLTTGNKSEMAVGYATLYGDMAGGFAPLKDVPKTQVYRLAEWRNRQSQVIPQRVIERPPSAELAPHQKDSDSLPPYEVLDPLLERYIEQDQPAEAIIAAGFDAKIVQEVIRLVDRNEYKRRQAAPGVRITQRAFGRDRRYPITSGYRDL